MSKKQSQLTHNRVCRPRLLAAAIFAAMPFLQASVSQAAPFDISNVPLYLGGTLEPNLMYIHDDSGSMFWSYLPDNASSNSVRATSSYSNLQYYDPTATYLPPLDHNGNSLGDSVFTSAWFEGYNLSSRNSNRRNLATNFCPTWSGTGCLGSQQPAYYHQFSPPQGGCPAPGSTTDTDCYVKVIVPAAQRQNFANWYSYYRTRVYSAKAGISRAFATLGEGIRVGYGRINQHSYANRDGKNVKVIERGVRAFAGADRKDFFDWLFTAPASGGTPLRQALDSAGQYFDNDNAIGPWSTTPGVSGGEHLSCRKSFTILMTDGYWNGGDPSTGPKANNDGTSGPGHSGPGSASYTYSAVSPFTDSYSKTLSDVAMYYWKNDLSGLDNRVPTTATNPAFWQHMSTYTIGFGLSGTINPDGAFDAITSGASISWQNPVGTSDGDPRKIDDLLHAAVNSRGGYFSASNPTEFADALAKTLAAINKAVSTASGAIANSTRLGSDTMIYQATYDSGDWTSEFLAYELDPTNGKVISPAAWNAADSIPAYGARSIFTWIPDTPPSTPPNGSGAKFEWSALTTAQKAELADDSTLLDYLRGDTSNEGTAAGKFRKRNSKLGDIVNSTAAFVGTQDFGYGIATGLDATTRQKYKERRADTSYKTRAQTLYVGANDGMLHAFDATSGIERFAFVPNALFGGGHLAELAQQDYTHRYYVDGSPKAADAYLNGAWHTYLVGSTGAGGRSYFALDVESATSFNASKVLWEFTDADDADLGIALGQASIVRTESGDWVALFGNGYNGDSNTASLFILDLEDGTVLKKLDTGVGTAANPNGLSTPIAVDSDQNGNVDLVYAGDMYGNLWKFNLSGGSSSTWTIEYDVNPLFTAKDSSGKRQPITGKPQVARFAAHGKPEVIVYFGTGKFFEVGDQGAVSDPQAIYGIVDECVRSSCGASKAVLKSDLLKQTIFKEQHDLGFVGDSATYNNDIRLITDDPMTAGQKGFYIDLISPLNGVEGERMITQPAISEDRVQFISMIPDPDPCSAGVWTWFLELDPSTGGRTKFSPFDLNKDGDFSDEEFVSDGSGGSIPVSGRRTAGNMVPSTLEIGVDGGSKGCVEIIPGVEPTAGSKICPGTGRRSWRQIR